MSVYTELSNAFKKEGEADHRLALSHTEKRGVLLSDLPEH
jgi:hypothetical protein